jgi:ABC-type sugar transport system ATPase subunit
MPPGITIKGYSDPPRIPELDLEVNTGEFVLLVGESGSGKSRLVRRLAGIEQSGGSGLTIAGGLPGSPAALARSTFLFQGDNLDRDREVVQQLVRRLCLRGIHRRDAGRLVMDWCVLLGVTDLLHRKPADLNLEQVQLLSFAPIVLWQPGAVVLDEPLSNLGAAARTEVTGWIGGLRGHASVLAAVSDPSGLREVADRTVFLTDGGASP